MDMNNIENRIIKFRAWDGIRMTTSGIMFNSTTGELEVPEGSQMVIMQFIEDYDKNGKEIYDKDIVIIPAGYGGDTDHKEAIGIIYYGADFALSDNLSDYGYDELEVIGNRLENPELVKDFDFKRWE